MVFLIDYNKPYRSKGVSMREFYNIVNKKIYYLSCVFMIIIMSMGLFVLNPRMEAFDFGYVLHLTLVTLFSICILIYPKYETYMLRFITITIASLYFYALFFLYPDTWSTFIFLCLIPAFSILYFDSKIFYFSLVLNFIFISVTLLYIILVDQGKLFSHIEQDLVGNTLNFVGSQIVIFLIYFLSDVRNKKQQLYYEQIQQTERLKTTGQLAAAVAHEIRNPLTVVKGFLQLFEKEPTFDDKKKKHFKLMIDELNIAEHVITQFLSLAKPNAQMQLQAVNVSDSLESVTDLLSSYGLFHDISIVLEIEEDCVISINEMEFKQVMINLIKNAIEASSTGKDVHVKAKRDNNYVFIEVQDQGQGMSEKAIQSLGTPFYSLKTKGTGLGLMICFQIIEKYRGTIHFQSELDRGTRVVIRLLSTSSAIK